VAQYPLGSSKKIFTRYYCPKILKRVCQLVIIKLLSIEKRQIQNHQRAQRHLKDYAPKRLLKTPYINPHTKPRKPIFEK
jgi:hypothetical protein